MTSQVGDIKLDDLDTPLRPAECIIYKTEWDVFELPSLLPSSMAYLHTNEACKGMDQLIMIRAL